MITFERKRRYSKDTTDRNAIVQGGVPLLILIFTLIVLISNFSITSQSDAKLNVNDIMIDKATTYAARLSYDLTGMTYAGQSAASLMASEETTNMDEWKKHAASIKGSIPAPYLVAVVQMDGKGASSEHSLVNLSNTDYFIQTQTQKYLYTEDDGILHRKAFVSVVPVCKDREAIAMIYLYTSVNEISKALPVNEFDGAPSFAVIDSTGKILAATGRDTIFTKEENLLSCLENSTLTELDMEKIKRRIDKQTRFVFGAQNGSESKALIVAPLGIGDWYLTLILNQTYMQLEQKNDWQNARNMVYDLAIAGAVFLGVLLVMFVVNRIRYNERNRNLEDKADTDLLTGLYNKIATERKIQEYLDQYPNDQCMLFLFDIDNFKKINDTMGHAFGDEVLHSLGHQLANEFRVSDIIGRTGGDEFIVFLKNIKEEVQLEKEGLRISNFFHQFNAGGEYVKYSATASIGAAVYPRDGENFIALYKASDEALYEAKKRGKKQLVFYNDELEKRTEGQRTEIPIDRSYTFK